VAYELNIRRFLASGIAPAVGLGLLVLTCGALAANAGDYAPENLERSYGRLKWLCMLNALCPVSEKALGLIKGVLANDRSSEYLLGLTLLVGDDLPTDRRSGVAWIALAAERGDPAAARDISSRLRNGEAIEVDETKIATALQAQADVGDAESMRALGPMLIGGRGVKQDPPTGLDLLRRAADKGSTGAEIDLSQLYLNGAPGVPKNRPEAMKWLAASANHGNLQAMVNLGYMSVNGAIDAPSTDLAVGYCWLMRAALADQPQAQEKLSSIFTDGAKDDHGTVIDADLVQADLWFRIAARSPYHDNSQIRAAIEPQMTTEQLNQANSRSRKRRSGWPRWWVPHGPISVRTHHRARTTAPHAVAAPMWCRVTSCSPA
jgi:TPR repeat protein